MRATHALIGATVLTAAASAALADPVRLDHNILQGTGSGFGFSVLHAPRNSEGAGSILFRYFGTMQTVYDESANTLTFTRFEADLFRERNLNPNTVGARAGSLSLVAGQMNIDPTTNIMGGSLTLRMNMADGRTGDATFFFQPIAYNGLANRWNPVARSFGLWGATADVFGEEIPETGSGVYGLGMDLAGSPGASIVPLPSGVALGAVGLVGTLGRRRRR